MRVRLLYFASLKDRAGVSSDDLELADGATMQDAIATVTALHPSLEPLGHGVRFARNRELVDDVARLADGDELALLPPVSGG